MELLNVRFACEVFTKDDNIAGTEFSLGWLDLTLPLYFKSNLSNINILYTISTQSIYSTLKVNKC